MNFFKKRSTAWVVLLFSVIISVSIGQIRAQFNRLIPDTPSASTVKSKYIVDNANVLTSSTKEHIVQMNNVLENRTGAIIMVVTEKTAKDKDLFDIAIGYAEETKLTANSLIVVIATSDGDAIAVQGEGIMYSLDDDEVTDIMVNYLKPDFDRGDYDKGMLRVYNAFIDWYQDYYGVKISNIAQSNISTGSFDVNGLIKLVFIIIVLLVVLSVLSSGKNGRNTTRRPYSTNYPGSQGGYFPNTATGTRRSSSGSALGGSIGSILGRGLGSNSNSRSSSNSSRSSTTGSGFGSSSSRGGGFSSGRSSSSFGSSSRGGGFSARSSSGFGSSSRGGGFSSGSSRGGGFGRK